MGQLRFIFVPMLDHRVRLTDQGIRTMERLGDCNLADGTIRIVPKVGWQQTAVHEVVHLYNPDANDRKIEQLANEIIRLLKWEVSQKGGNRAATDTPT